MSARQLIVLAVAAVAAVLALVLIRGALSGREPAAAEDAAANAIVGEQVLVVSRDLPQGAALTPSDLAVATFPTESVSETFVRISAQPSAQADMVGAVTRRPFVRGEPITTNAVIQPEGRGFLAAQLQPGYRAVSVEIDRQTAAGGFIQPNDHVDIIVTQSVDGQGAQSDILLEDVRILAIGDVTQPQTTGEAPAVVAGNVAVLELTAEDARALAMADQRGAISLALRGVQVDTVGMNSPRRRSGQSGAVRIHQFGTVSGGG